MNIITQNEIAEQNHTIAQWNLPRCSDDLPVDRVVEIAAMIVNGQVGHTVDMSDASALEEIKEMAREHRDDRGHVVTLRRVRLEYKAIEVVDTVGWQWREV